MDRQTLRDWVHRYNEAGAVGLLSRKPPGVAPKLTTAQMQELRQVTLAGPDPERHDVTRWRYCDLQQEIACALWCGDLRTHGWQMGIHPVKLSITHKLHTDHYAEFDICLLISTEK